MLLVGDVDILLLQETLVWATDVRARFVGYSDYYSFGVHVAS
jgi:hypothetical protein